MIVLLNDKLFVKGVRKALVDLWGGGVGISPRFESSRPWRT